MAEPAPVYDPDDEKAVTGPPDLHVLPGSGDNPEILKKAEENGGVDSSAAGDASEVAQEQSALADDQVGKGFNPDDKSRFRGRFSRRKKIIGGGIAGTVITGALIFSIGQGPFQIIHFAQLLQRFHFTNNENFMDRRTARYIRYLIRGDAQRGRLGVIGNNFADKLEVKLNRTAGLRSVYNANGRLIGYEVIDRNKSIDFLGDADFGDDADFTINQNGPPSTAHVIGPDGSSISHSGGPYIDLDANNFNTRRSFTRILTKATGTNKVASRLAARLLIKRGGIDFHPLKNVKRKAADTLLKYYEDRKKERAERRSDGVDPPDTKVAQADEDPNGDGNNDNNEDGVPDSSADTEAAEREAKAAAKEITDTPIDGPSTLQKLRSSLTVRFTAGGVAVVGILCTIRGLGDEAENLQHAQIILPMMRIGGEIITSGNQVMASGVLKSELADVNADELGSITDDLYDKGTPDLKPGDEGYRAPSSWASARSIQAELGQEPTGPDIPRYAKPSKVGEKPGFFSAIDGIPGMSAACGIQSAIGGLPIIKEVSGFASSVISSILPVEELINGIVGWLAGNAVNVFAKGAELGNLANYGARLAANDQAIATGGRELTGTEVAALDQDANTQRQKDFEHKSFFARLFDLNETNSLAAKALEKMPSNIETIATVLTSPIKTFSSIFSVFSGVFKPAYAAPEPYDYDFNEFGFSLGEQEDPRFEDPFANARIVEPRLASLNNRYGDCFSMTIDPATGDLRTGPAKRYDQIDARCKTSNLMLSRYRFYIADSVTEHTLACNEGVESSCQQLGFGNTSVQVGGGGLGINADGFVFPVKATKSLITNNRPPWCYKKQTNCHHRYNAADIHAPPGTPVVAARGGTVTSRTNKAGGVGSRVHIKGDDGNLYYYAHMGVNTIPGNITPGTTVTAGQQIGAVGTNADAEGTPSHVHFDALPGYSFRPSCSNAACQQYPFINVQSVLISAFQNLPD